MTGTDPFVKDIVRRALNSMEATNTLLLGLQRQHELGEINLGDDYRRVETCGGIVYDELTALKDMVEQAKTKGIY